MATLISPIKHSVSKNFRKDIRTVKFKKFDFEPGQPCEIDETEFADSLHATYPDKYFTPEEWNEKNGIIPETDENELPSLEELEGKDIHELKKIADLSGIKYAQNISAKTLAARIHEHYTAPDEDTATTDEPVSEED